MRFHRLGGLFQEKITEDGLYEVMDKVQYLYQSLGKPGMQDDGIILKKLQSEGEDVQLPSLTADLLKKSRKSY